MRGSSAGARLRQKNCVVTPARRKKRSSLCQMPSVVSDFDARERIALCGVLRQVPGSIAGRGDEDPCRPEQRSPSPPGTRVMKQGHVG